MTGKKCFACERTDTVTVALTISIPPGSLLPDAPQEKVGETAMCPMHLASVAKLVRKPS